MPISEITAALESIEASYALIGGHAVVVRGYLRTTLDYDFLTTDKRALQSSTWETLTNAAVDIRKGDFDDQFRGVVHIRLSDGTDVDVIVAKWRWEQGVIDRAERMEVEGIQLLVPRTSDLILLKLAAGGHHDLRDASILLELSDREQMIREVEEHLTDVRPDVTAVWKQLLASL